MPHSYKGELVIFTATLYKDDEISKVRQKLALSLFRNAQKLGIQCSVVDSGSNEDFIDEVSRLPNVHLTIERSKVSMGENRRQALREALKLGAPYVMWVEPEKDGLVIEKNIEQMVRPLREGKVDIVVPHRTKESFASLPKLQSWIEQRANRRATVVLNEVCGPVDEQMIDHAWDLWFGPKMMNREGAKYFEAYKGELDKWDAIIKPVHNAFCDGKRIGSVVVDYVYDESQKDSEEHNREMKRKRIDQYTQILKELGDRFWIEKLEEKQRMAVR